MSHSSPGQLERATQARVLALFRDRLGYRTLGDWTDRAGNRNVEPGLLLAFLKRRKVDDALATRALDQLEDEVDSARRAIHSRPRSTSGSRPRPRA